MQRELRVAIWPKVAMPIRIAECGEENERCASASGPMSRGAHLPVLAPMAAAVPPPSPAAQG